MRFTEEESVFLEQTLPRLSVIKARKLLNLANWISGEPGDVLTVEGEKPPHLVYLAFGQAQVVTNGRAIALCNEKSFIGEITGMSDEVATASVSLTRVSRYMSFAAKEIRELVRRDAEIRLHLENCFAQEVKQKLVASNRAMAT